MKLTRRKFMHLATGAAVPPALSDIAWAQQAYPARPIRLIVGYPAAGPTDITARLIGQWLSDHLGKPVVIENRPGVSGSLATEAVVHAAPDGYTLLLAGVWDTINATLYRNLNFTFLNDIAPVAGLIRYSNVMLVPPSFPAKTVPEFIAYAKANPGKVNMAAPGVGTSQHLSGELFNMMVGLNMTAVQYRGSAPALTDLMASQVQVMFDAVPSSIAHIKSGRLRALAVTASARSEALPDVQSVADFVPGYEASGWNGIGAPKSTPNELIVRLNNEVNAGLTDPTLRARFAELGGTTLPGSPAAFGKLISEETEKWAKVIEFARIKPD
jgi:tripartite-type tricarboxylate transporter receptor subunit TctC